MAAHYLGKRHETSQEEQRSFSRIIDCKSIRQDRLQPKGARPIHRALSIHPRAMSTKTTVSYNTASQYILKPLPPLPSASRPRRETLSMRDSVLDSSDQCSLTTSLRRNFSLNPLPLKTTYYRSTPCSPPPQSPSSIVKSSPDPFVLRSQPALPSTPASQPTRPVITQPYHIATSSNLHFPPLIKRKPAPARGQDWVDQWDELFAIQGTQGFGLRKVLDKRNKN